MSTDVLAATTTSMLLDFAAVRLNPEKAAGVALKLNVELVDRGERHLIAVENGVLVHEAGVVDARAGATVRLRRPDLLATLLAGVPSEPRIASRDIVVEGDRGLYARLAGLIDPIVADFPIVTP
jgi:alkyl sulfatase BDS1-like metallo-beta-lactamase superfamily hydrolase